MMDTLREWITGICVAAVAASAAKIITPSGSMQRTMKIVSAALVLCIIISPLIGEVSFNFGDELDSVYIESSGELEKTAAEQTERYTEAQLKTLIEPYLKKYGIERAEISIIMERDENMRISLICAEIGISAGDMPCAASAEKNIEQELGIETMFYSYNGG